MQRNSLEKHKITFGLKNVMNFTANSFDGLRNNRRKIMTTDEKDFKKILMFKFIHFFFFKIRL